VRRFAKADNVDDLLAKARSRSTLLDEFKPHLHQRFNDGHTDATALCREIQALGYRGSPQTVRHYLQSFRSNGIAPSSTPAGPKIREVARWILTRPDDLDPQYQRHLDRILQRSPLLAAAAEHVRAFAGMMNDLAGHRLPDWIHAVTSDDLPALHSFVTGIRRDFDAVTAGLTLPYSSGAVEGHVCRIKMMSSSRGHHSPRLSQNRQIRMPPDSRAVTLRQPP
jgi:transposase